eukprot:snap_masked-scaffold_5-processed-gene-7.13-mRNA-1 protein AED:1.00 eAED:1.00 QI:0/0/0/0/1/1/2/0/82
MRYVTEILFQEAFLSTVFKIIPSDSEKKIKSFLQKICYNVSSEGTDDLSSQETKGNTLHRNSKSKKGLKDKSPTVLKRSSQK